MSVTWSNVGAMMLMFLLGTLAAIRRHSLTAMTEPVAAHQLLPKPREATTGAYLTMLAPTAGNRYLNMSD